MRAIQHPIPVTIKQSNTAKWSIVAFFIYLFFVVFGTQMPFQPSLQEREAVGAIGSSNLINQLLSLLFVVALFGLLGKQQRVFQFIRQEKFLTLFLIWSLCSVFWSQYPMVSLKRWITLFGEVLICLSILLNVRWSEVALRYFRIILFIYLPLTILSVIFVHEAIQWQFPAWRGLAITKNNLGQVALFSIITWLVIIPYNRKRPINAVHYFMLGLALTAYLGARSTTSFLVGAFLLFIAGLLYTGRLFKQGVVARFFAFSVVIGSISIVAITGVFAPELMESFFGLFGKDLTFTGRVDLWETVLRMTQDRILTGWGLGGFWVMDGRHLIPVFLEFVWIPNQSHQGYIDILNQTGIIGISLLLLMIFQYLIQLPSLKKRNVWQWFFIGVLILNLQESVFFRPRHMGHFVFVFAYIAFYTDLIKQKYPQI